MPIVIKFSVEGFRPWDLVSQYLEPGVTHSDSPLILDLLAVRFWINFWRDVRMSIIIWCKDEIEPLHLL